VRAPAVGIRIILRKIGEIITHFHLIVFIGIRGLCGKSHYHEAPRVAIIKIRNTPDYFYSEISDSY
jgi:hypothetical protein